MPSHQLSNGLYVSGLPEQYKERQPTFKTTAMPYTGGDVKKSGELGKMFDIQVVDPPKQVRKSDASARGGGGSGYGGGGGHNNSGPLTTSGAAKIYSASGPLTSAGLPRQSSSSGAAQNRSGPLTASGRPSSHSGPLTRSAGDGGGGMSGSNNTRTSSGNNSRQNSGPLSRQNSGSLIPATGLITSGPLSSAAAPGGAAAALVSHPKKAAAESGGGGGGMKAAPSAVNVISRRRRIRMRVPMVILWVVVPLFMIGLIAGGFIWVTVRNGVVMVVVAAVVAAMAAVIAWNVWVGRKWEGNKVWEKYYGEDADLREAKDGDYVKVTGVVTCGSTPLESSFHHIPRCIFTSTSLFEYRTFHSKPAKPGHRLFSWALRHSELHIVDFYISDFQSGLRALVKSGYGSPVIPFVPDSFVVEINGSSSSRDLPPDFLRWIAAKNLSCDHRLMHLKEGYVKEGSTVTVFGVVHRHENVLMIVPPRMPISTGCLWSKLWLPRTVDSLIISCEDVYRNDGIPL